MATAISNGITITSAVSRPPGSSSHSGRWRSTTCRRPVAATAPATGRRNPDRGGFAGVDVVISAASLGLVDRALRGCWASAMRDASFVSSTRPADRSGIDCTTTFTIATWTWLQPPLNGVPTDFDAESTIAASAGSPSSTLASAALVGSSPNVR